MGEESLLLLLLLILTGVVLNTNSSISVQIDVSHTLFIAFLARVVRLLSRCLGHQFGGVGIVRVGSDDLRATILFE